MAILRRLRRGDRPIFDQFVAVAARIETGATTLRGLLGDPSAHERGIPLIAVLEHEADAIVRDVHVGITRSFIPPIDSEDVHAVANKLDDVMDRINATARLVKMLDLRAVQGAAVRLADLIVQLGAQLSVMAGSLRDSPTVLAGAAAVRALEEEGDRLYGSAMTDLFTGRPDALAVLKWKELYELLENTLDAGRHAAGALETVALKYA